MRQFAVFNDCFAAGLCAILILSGCASIQARYIKQHPELTPEQATAVRSKMVISGLSKDAVTASLGRPQKTYGYKTDKGFFELWLYSEFEWQENENVLFRDGAVVSWNFPKSIKRKLDEEAVEKTIS